MKLKTLKDFELGIGEHEEIRQEAIKWVKEDKEVLERLHPEDVGTWTILMMRWMKRLNITEGDLK